MSPLKRRAFIVHFTRHRAAGLAGALATALIIAPLPAPAEPAPNPAHAIAHRFAEDAQRAEAQRKEAARAQAQKRREEAARAAKAKTQKAHEAEMLARARTEAEERRKLEEEAARLDVLRAEREAREAEAERQRTEKARLIEAAREAEQQRLAEQARDAEEAKRAAEALRIAVERAAAEEARKAEEARQAEMTRQAEEAARRAEAERAAEAQRQAELAARKAEETRRAEEARQAEEIRKANEALRIAVERAAAEESARAEADKRAAEARRVAEQAAAEEARRVADLEADAEIARVAERLRQIREEHLARHTGITPAPPATPSTLTAAAPIEDPTTVEIDERTHETSSGRARIVQHDEYRDVPLQPPRNKLRPIPAPYPRAGTEPKLPFDGRVTILLQMEPRYRRGRRYESMDPVLCTADGCYVSNGPSEPASFIHGGGATRFGNAIGRRAGACNRAYTCVFRNVDIGALPADVQPVDIRVIRHDRREPEQVDALSSCRLGLGDRLACTGAIEGDGFTMWVISEADAERLPPHVFHYALSNGLVDGERAEADVVPRRGRW